MKKGPKPLPLADRFWRNVDRSNEDGCWEWTGARTSSPWTRRYNFPGYGYSFIGSRADGTHKGIPAHRLSWMVNIGPIPEGMIVCHHCDNPPCVRPDHLFLGTKGDNTRDMVRKGRHGSRTHPERWANAILNLGTYAEKGR